MHVKGDFLLEVILTLIHWFSVRFQDRAPAQRMIFNLGTHIINILVTTNVNSFCNLNPYANFFLIILSLAIRLFLTIAFIQALPVNLTFTLSLAIM